MASYSAKMLVQIAFNLLLLVILLVLLIRIVGNLIASSGHLGENLFLLAVVGLGLFIGVSFLMRLIREGHGKDRKNR